MKPVTKDFAYQIFYLLEKHYPHAKMILEWGNHWELLAAIILSAQCTDSMVNKVTAKIFPKYRKVFFREMNSYEWEPKIYKIPKEEFLEMVHFAVVPLSELEEDIKSTGFYKNKAKNIQAAAKVMLEKFHGIFPKTIDALITIPGVGRKTANVFLGNAYHLSEGIAVDTHVKKQAQLLGLTNNTTPEKIEQDLMKLYDQKDWFKLTYLLIEHGRNMRKKQSDRILCGEEKCIICSQ